MAGRIEDMTRRSSEVLGARDAAAVALAVLPSEVRGLFADGSREDALRILRNALANAPDDAKANYHLGSALLLVGLASEAWAPLRKAAVMLPKGAAAWARLAEAEIQIGRPDHAAVSLRHAISLRPEWAAVRLRYGQILLGLGRFQRAMEQAVAVLDLDARSSDAHRLHGLALSRLRRFDEAAAAFAAWVRTSPGEVKPLFFLARARLLAGNCGGARNACQRAIDLDGGLLRGQLLMARIAVNLGNPRLRQTHLEKCVEMRPESATLRVFLAEVLLGRNQLGSALDAAQTACALNPKSRAAVLAVARCYIAVAEFAKARAALGGLSEPLPEWAAAIVRARPEKAIVYPALGPSATAGADTKIGGHDSALSVTEGPSVGDPPPSSTPSWLYRRDSSMRRSPIATLREGFDDFAAFISLEKALVLRDILFETRTRRNFILVDLARGVVVIIAHVYFFYFINRAVPANISMVEFCAPAFTIWFLFKGATDLTKVGSGYSKSNASINVKWIHLLLGAFLVKYLVPIIGLIIVIMFFFLFYDTRVMGMKYFPDVGSLASIWAITCCMGLGFGFISDFIKKYWLGYALIYKVLMWILYITCGVYQSFVLMPSVLAPYFILNPLIPLVEFSRRAIHAGYPIWGGPTLIYPLVLAGIFLVSGLVVHGARHSEAPG
jgi:tetratricopeptide (TPR) repeat protein/ABC-type polysaccharide/polyol phosphate export permease